MAKGSFRATSAKGEYSREDEQVFRRELENAFLQVVSSIEGIATGVDTNASLHSKRERMTIPAIGIQVY